MFRSIRSLLGLGGKKKPAQKPSKFFKNTSLKLEALEDRTTPAVALAYVNSAWAGFVNGQVITNPDPTISGEADAVFGSTAFSDVQGGVNAVTTGSAPTTGNILTLLPGTYPGNVNLNGQFYLNVLPGNATISGVVSGAPGVEFDIGKVGLTGTGSLTLSGANTYAGNTVVSRGRLLLSNDNQLGATSGVLSVNTPAVVEITGNMTTSRTIALNSATLQVDAGKILALSGAEIDGGSITSGPGTPFGTVETIDLLPTSFNSVRTTTSLVLKAKSNTTFNTFDNGGTLDLAATKTFTLTSFNNTSSGKMFVNGTANVTDFVTIGQITVSPTGKIVNVGSSGLTFGGGSNTTVNRLGPVDNINDGFIDLGSVNSSLAGGLMTNNGLVGSFTSGVSFVVDFGGRATGTGVYSSVVTINGGVSGAGGGGAPNNQAVISGATSGSVQKNTSLITSGTLSVFDADPGQSSFQSASDLTSFGSYTLTTGGSWVYTLNNNSPAVQALGAGATLADSFTALSFDGTPQLVSITINGATNPNSVPIAQASSVSIPQGSPTTIYTFAVSDFHFTDVENNPLSSITLGTLNFASGDTLTLGGSSVSAGQTIAAGQIPNLVYAAPGGQSGNPRSTFTFTANDAGLGTLAATMSINVTVNNLPVAVSSTVTTNEDTAKQFSVSDFHFTDIDSPPGPLASITIGSLNLAGGDALRLGTATNSPLVTNGQTIPASQISSLTYRPAANANGNGRSTFTFTVNDSGLGTASATMSIDVISVPDAPVAQPSSVTTIVNNTKIFAPSDFLFTDADGDPLDSITIKLTNPGLAAGDTLTLNGSSVTDGQKIFVSQLVQNSNGLVYSPATNQQGLARSKFNFIANDAVTNGSAQATMTLNVSSGTNFAPVVTTTGSALAYTENGAATAVDPGITITDTDNLSLVSVTVSITGAFTPGDALSYSDPTGGKVDGAVSGGGQTLTLTAHAGQSPNINDFQTAARAVKYASSSDNPTSLPGGGTPTRTVTFTANDGSVVNPIGAASRNINITAINDAPTAVASNVTTNEDTSYTFSTSDFRFSDPEGDNLVSITIGTRSLALGDTLRLGSVDVVNGQTITLSQIQNQILVYAPAPNQNGNARSTFTFTTNDANLGNLAATMSITVNSVNDLPIANNSAISLNEDTTFTFSTSNFQFSDVEGDGLQNLNIGAFTLPSGDTFALSSGGSSPTFTPISTGGQTITSGQIASLVYIPAANANGNARFAFPFTITDSQGGVGTASATMTANVLPVNDAPTAQLSSVTTVEDTAGFTFGVSDFQFTDLEGDALASITITGNVDKTKFTPNAPDNTTIYAQSGDSFSFNGSALTSGTTISASQIAAGLLVYKPGANANGAGRSGFSFRVNDANANGTSGATATMVVNVTAVNDAPVAVNSSVTTNENSGSLGGFVFSASNFKFNDVDFSGTPPTSNIVSVTITGVSLASGDSLKLNGQNVATGGGNTGLPVTIPVGNIPQLVYVPKADSFGNARSTFTFQVNDVDLGPTVATMSINVSQVNHVPLAQTSNITTNEDTSFTFTGGDLKSTDGGGNGSNNFKFTDPSDNPKDQLASITIGTVNLATNLAPISAASQIGTTVTITTSSAHGFLAGQSVVITGVTPNGYNGTFTISGVPSSTSFTYTTAPGLTAGIGFGTATVADSLTVGGVPIVSGQTITAAQFSSFVYTPAANANGTARSSFTFTVNDTGASNNVGIQSATMFLNVTSVNDLPAATTSAVTTNEDTPFTFAVSNFGYTDVENDPLASITIGTVSLASGDTLLLSGVAVNASQTITAAQIPNLVYKPAPDQNGNARSTFTYTVNDAGNGTVAATMFINVTPVNDAFASVATTTNGNEAGPVNGRFTVTLTNSLPTATVLSYSIGGTATAGVDYTALTGTVTIPAGQTSASIDVVVSNDSTVELNETVVVTLTSVSGDPNVNLDPVAGNRTATVTIASDDAAVVSISSPSVTEGGQLAFVVSISNPVDVAVTANEATQDGTATTADSDYTALSATAATLFAANSTAPLTINVNTIGDTKVEANEALSLILSSLSAGGRNVTFNGGGGTLTGTGTIVDNDASTVAIAATTNGNEAGPVNGQFTVTLSNPSSTNTVVSYTVGGGSTATAGSDYTALSGTVTILAGATTATIDVPVINDTTVEPTETVNVTLTSVTSGNPSITLAASPANTATVNITDNDSATVSIASTANGNETGPANGQFTVTLSNPSSTNTVVNYTVGGTATSGSDYTGLSGSVTIVAGATTATISVPVIDDSIVEGTETVNATLTSIASGNPGVSVAASPANTATVNIADNDTATVSITATTNGNETGPVNGVFSVTMTNPSSTDTVVNYTVGGTAAAGSDYTALSGSVTILAGNTSATINVPVLNDSTVEPAETVIVTLTSISSANAGITLAAPPANTATVNIADNDTSTISIAATTNGSETGPSNGVFTVTMTNPSSTDTVVNYTVGGTATSGSDYSALSGSVTILAGTTAATISVPVINDATVESSESVVVTLTSITSGNPGVTLAAPPANTATLTITDNDTSSVSIAATTSGNETGPVNGAFTVSMTNASSTDTVVSYTVSGTATPGSDYTALSGSVTILAGNTSATITVPVVNDSTVEPTETVIVTLTSVTSGNAGVTVAASPANTATVNIIDNDGATVSIANTANGNETGPVNGVFTVTMSSPSAVDTVISYSVGGTATAGSDYTALSGSVTILAGNTAATITVPVLNDATVEPTETVIVTLTGITSGAGGITVAASPANTATVNITDNDTSTVSVASTTNGNETGPVNGVFTVTMTNASSTDTVIAYSVGGTATSGSDFAGLSGSVTILAGSTTATITVPVVNDPTVEPTETVVVTLTSITSSNPGITLAASPANTATLNIVDNDTSSVSIANTGDGSETGPANGQFTVTMTSPSSTDTVVSYTVGGTATAGLDYTPLTGSVTILAGNTSAAISVPVLNDSTVEPTETVTVTLNSVTSGNAGVTVAASPNNAATLNITDNDTATASVAATTNGNEAGPVNGVFTVTLSNPSSTDTVISYSVGGTATAGSDYTALSGSVTVLAGNTTATITVPVTDDNTVEPTETVILTLTSIISGNAGITVAAAPNNTATMNITDNDTATASIVATTNASEAGPTSGLFTVTLSKASSTDTVISYTVGGTATASSDYTALTGTVTVLAGATTATINVAAIDDTIVEAANETVIVTLSSITSGNAGVTVAAPPNNTATVNIVDNDSATLSINNVAMNEGNAGTTAFVFTVTLSAAVDIGVNVDYASQDVTATSTGPNADYTAVMNTLNFAGTAGETHTITVLVNGDLHGTGAGSPDIGGTEFFQVILSNIVAAGRNVTFGNNPGFGSIQNDDGANP